MFMNQLSGPWWISTIIFNWIVFPKVLMSQKLTQKYVLGKYLNHPLLIETAFSIVLAEIYLWF